MYPENMLRIHGGIYKGRKLKTVNDPGVRPTTAKLKLAFFDILQTDIKETVFLDGFGGSGNVGLEAISRGADYVVFIDQLQENLKVLKHNIDKIEIPSDYYRLIKGDYNRSIIQLHKEGMKFDIVFLDPPYKLLEYANPLKILYKRNVLAEDGIVVLERPKSLKFDAKYFECYKTHTLGQKCLDFYRLPKEAQTED